MEPQKDEKKSPIKSLRTYQGDIDEILSKGKASMSSIVIAEQKRKSLLPEFEKKVTSSVVRNKSFIYLGFSIVLIGLIIIGTVYYFIETSNKVSIEKKTKALVTYSQEKIMPVASSTGSQIVAAIVAENSNFKSPVNSILYLNTTDSAKNALDTSTIFGKIAPNMPDSLVRSFGDKYMIGVYSFDVNAPFIILSIDDFPDGYAGMLRWEKNMVYDLGGMFNITAGNLGTTTPKFQDEALRNKDLRIIKNAVRQTVLLYSFVDDHTLIITANEDIFEGLLGKYLISQNVK